MTILRAVLVMTVTLLLLVGCGGDPDGPEPTEPQATALEDAADVCGKRRVGNLLGELHWASRHILVEDEGQTVIVHGGDQFSTQEVGFCLLDKLDAPASTMGKVEGTTAMMGRLTDTFDDYELTWSYHPDSGLDMIIETVT